MFCVAALKIICNIATFYALKRFLTHCSKNDLKVHYIVYSMALIDYYCINLNAGLDRHYNFDVQIFKDVVYFMITEIFYENLNNSLLIQPFHC